tara:strand:- start:295 stop:1902 length:1608 start_codon:yes stop_codon:yes gene_type:complete
VSGVHEHEVIVIGAGVAGIYQIKRLVDLGADALVLEAEDDLGGTWFRNRYPGCRFDSESYTYGYSFSQEILDTWHWKELFSSQPENLRYLNHVADLFGLREHMRFGVRIASMVWDEAACSWTLTATNGETFCARFVITALGPLSSPTLPAFEGMDEFAGESFHTFRWPDDLDLTGKRVGQIGTGATGIQIVPSIAPIVEHLTVFQRRPNWSSRLNNRSINEEEMAEIRRRYPEIFENCSTTVGGFEHVPRWGFWEATPEERRALWDELYTRPGFAIIGANYAEIYFDEAANQELSDYIADRIRGRVDDPEVAEKLIPTDHGFALQRLPLETNYFEAYNRDNVELVSLQDTPIVRVTADGIETTASHHDLDVIVYATGFDAITGAFDRIDIWGVDGAMLADEWADGPRTAVGMMTRGFPNLLMLAGPQSVSGSTNFPRAIEDGVEWVSDLIEHARSEGITRIEAEQAAEEEWATEVGRMQDRLLIRNSKGWFTGYNANLAGREGKPRYQAYFGGAPRYRTRVAAIAEAGYPGFDLR